MNDQSMQNKNSQGSQDSKSSQRENPTLLLLRIEGPMQSWGTRSRWDSRDSGTEPTKSAIMGLLACSLGYRRTDMRIEQELEANFTMGIREELPSIMKEDFQTIHGDLPCADGSVKFDSTIISRRQYLSEASFLVVLHAPKDLIMQCALALQKPHWPYYLGRKAFVPCRPVFEAVTSEYSSILEALSKVPWLPRTIADDMQDLIPARPDKLRCVIEKTADVNPIRDKKRQDRIRINPSRAYAIRYVDVIYVPTVSIPA